ncbi:DUF3750 domain-containing protein [Phytohalomonas tamaricis]|uniref:DUF3750 domain-containing protein n=1 Tax=Phytohalomonas tamaricis TaxID=2081032 RepID=UPI0021D48605|nr:DUF3750 domain-containing protein [Phytohalomonas tamaricis]
MLMMLLKAAVGLIAFVALLLAGPAYMILWGGVDTAADWATASRERAGNAPDPATTREAIVQVYGARAFSWRGAFAAHTWIAIKSQDARHYTIYEVMGWRRPTVSIHANAPDRAWFGNPPHLLAEIRGDKAAAAIPRLQLAASNYPYPQTYRIWPGANSNSFVAWMVRQAPELNVELPSIALGKDYLVDNTHWWGRFFAPAPSNSGYQFSLFGLLGIMVAREEGIEINVLGLVFGLDPLDWAIKLPGIGRIARKPLVEDNRDATDH